MKTTPYTTHYYHAEDYNRVEYEVSAAKMHHCNIKRRINRSGPANPSFCMTPSIDL